MINTQMLPPQLMPSSHGIKNQLINTITDMTWLERIELMFILHMNGAMDMNNNTHVFPIK